MASIAIDIKRKVDGKIIILQTIWLSSPQEAEQRGIEAIRAHRKNFQDDIWWNWSEKNAPVLAINILHGNQIIHTITSIKDADDAANKGTAFIINHGKPLDECSWDWAD